MKFPEKAKTIETESSLLPAWNQEVQASNGGKSPGVTEWP